MALLKRLGEAVARPFQPADVDESAHRDLERRRQALARRIERQRRDLARIGLLGVRAELHAREREGGES
jgi:hypothetical protein